VGVARYEHAELADLEYTERDVEALARLLEPAGYRVVLLTGAAGKADTNRRPTLANIRAALQEALAEVAKRDTVLVGLQFDDKKVSYF
jgi:hypothetical protein